MNKFEKKAMAKRAYRALVKMGADFNGLPVDNIPILDRLKYKSIVPKSFKFKQWFSQKNPKDIYSSVNSIPPSAAPFRNPYYKPSVEDFEKKY